MKALALLLTLSLLGAAPAARFVGKWNWKSGQGDFQISMREAGSKISGDMTGTAFNGNKVSTGSFEGTQTGNTARVDWHFKDGADVGPVAGSASMTLVSGKLHWTLKYDGNQECWFPRDALLRRSSPK